MLQQAGVGVLPGTLLLAGIWLLVVSPFAWGAGAHAGLAAWQPPLVGVVFALPAILLGYTTMRAVARKARHRFALHMLPLAFGVVFMLGGILVVWGLAAAVPDPDTYTSMLRAPAVSPEMPPAVAASQRGVQLQEDMSPVGFLAISLLACFVLVAWVWAASYLYTTAFDADPLMKFEARQAHEVDGVGMLLRGEPGNRDFQRW